MRVGYGSLVSSLMLLFTAAFVIRPKCRPGLAVCFVLHVITPHHITVFAHSGLLGSILCASDHSSMIPVSRVCLHSYHSPIIRISTFHQWWKSQMPVGYIV